MPRNGGGIAGPTRQLEVTPPLPPPRGPAHPVAPSSPTAVRGPPDGRAWETMPPVSTSDVTAPRSPLAMTGGSRNVPARQKGGSPSLRSPTLQKSSRLVSCRAALLVFPPHNSSSTYCSVLIGELAGSARGKFRGALERGDGQLGRWVPVRAPATAGSGGGLCLSRRG
jgi:hypothetical protein